MDLERIKKIINSDSQYKREEIIYTLADDETIMIDLLAIAQAKHQKDAEMLKFVNLTLSESYAFISSCKPTPNKPGVTREFLMKRIQGICDKFKKLRYDQ